MLRIILILLICFFNLFLYSDIIDLSWNKPAVKHEIDYSWLQNTDENIPLSIEPQEDRYDLAVSSWDKFAISLKKYIAIYDRQGNFFVYQPGKESNSYLIFKLRAGMDYSTFSDSSYYFSHYGWDMQGRIGKALYFYSQFWTGHFSEQSLLIRDHSPLVDSWLKYQDDAIYLDNIRGKLLYKSKYVDAALGRGRYEIGSNISGSVILNDSCNDYGYFNLDLKLGDLKFSVLNASLTADSSSVNHSNEYEDYRYNEDKYLSIHKIDWNPSDKLHLFMGEEVIYGAHSLKISYLMPFNFIRAMEHNLGDHDNVMIFAGWEWWWHHGLLNYGNLVLDELRKSEITGDWWGNKYAVQIGNSLDLGAHRVTLELTAVRPWLYTHKSIFTRYSHDKKGLGFPEGSNLIQIATAFDLQISNALKLNCLAAFIRQGEKGNNWSLNYQDEITDIDNEETKWLQGNPENRYKLQGVLTWKPLAHHWFKFGVNTQLKSDEDCTELYFSWLTSY